MTTINASSLSLEMKAWFEEQLSKTIGEEDKVVMYSYNPKGADEFGKEMKKARARRMKRMEVVAERMREAGMSKEDVECMLNHGLASGENHFSKQRQESLR